METLHEQFPDKGGDVESIYDSNWAPRPKAPNWDHMTGGNPGTCATRNSPCHPILESYDHPSDIDGSFKKGD